MSLLHHLDSNAQSVSAAPTRCELPMVQPAYDLHVLCPRVKYKYKLKDQCSKNVYHDNIQQSLKTARRANNANVSCKLQ